MNCQGHTIYGTYSIIDTHYSVKLFEVKNVTIRDCIIANFDYGVYIQDSELVSLLNNSMTNGGIYISGSNISHFSTHNISSDNTVGSKPVQYLKNTRDITVSSVVGQVILANVTNITLENQNISNVSVGIEIVFSNDSNIRNNDFIDTFRGIWFYNSSNNTIINNTIIRTGYGAYLHYSNNNVLTNNNLSNCSYGAYSLGSNDNTFVRNTVNNNYQRGIRFEISKNNTLVNNTINNNNYDGIYFFIGNDYNNLTLNTVNNNGDGIHFYSSDNNSLIENTVNNNGEGIHVDFSPIITT